LCIDVWKFSGRVGRFDPRALGLSREWVNNRICLVTGVVSAFSAGFAGSETPSIHVVGFVHSGIVEQAAKRPVAATIGSTLKYKRDITRQLHANCGAIAPKP
jgi:hypothetical protein